MVKPSVIRRSSFQLAWLAACRLLLDGGDQWNLVVSIKDSTAFDETLHERVSQFHQGNGVADPRIVAATIFPESFHRRHSDRHELYLKYNGSRGLFERMTKSRPTWGTYFRRLTNYEGSEAPVNQLENIITKIQSRSKVNHVAYTMLIPQPGSETVRPRGGPCLNYLALQVGDEDPPVANLLCVYRNHDFLTKAYGNYWGLCNLLAFLCTEVGYQPGSITCVSSHATVPQGRVALRSFVGGLADEPEPE